MGGVKWIPSRGRPEERLRTAVVRQVVRLTSTGLGCGDRLLLRNAMNAPAIFIDPIDIQGHDGPLGEQASKCRQCVGVCPRISKLRRIHGTVADVVVGVPGEEMLAFGAYVHGAWDLRNLE